MDNLKRRAMLVLASLSAVFLLQQTTVYAREAADVLAEVAQEGNVYEVKPDGTGDFVSIQEGVDSVESGDTLLIYPGTYEENVIIENKTVNLLGLSKEHCILTANTDNYHNIPLTIAAGRVYGLTICGTGSREKQRNISGTNEEGTFDSNPSMLVDTWQDQFSGYVIHVDHAYSKGKSLSVENCRIISSNNYCVGIGCWSGTEISIEDCELISGRSGCLFIHNNILESGASKVRMRNCELKNYVSPYVMAVHSKGESNPIELTFQNVKVYTVAYEYNACYHESNMNTWFPVELIGNPSVQAMLVEKGYMDIQKTGQLVHQRTMEQHTQFNAELEEQQSLLEDWPELAEGITYWENSSDTPPDLKKTRHCIEIKNLDKGKTGDGWCGLSSIYLTEDSYGNTLPEMNYPRPVMVVTATLPE